MGGWVQDMAGLVKSRDRNHLLGIGSISSGQCGTSTGRSFENLHANANVDVCEYHDYGQPTQPMPGDQWNGLEARLSQCRSLNKPLYVTESGLRPAEAGSPSARASMVASKFKAQFHAGVVGALLWDWRAPAHGPDGGDEFVIDAGDPVLNALRVY